jgi:hypothetical protein
MDGTALIVLGIIGLFLLYKTGIMSLTQNSMTVGSAMADKGLKVMVEEQDQSVARKLGKIKAKYEDGTTDYSSFKQLKAIKAKLDCIEEDKTS